VKYKHYLRTSFEQHNRNFRHGNPTRKTCPEQVYFVDKDGKRALAVVVDVLPQNELSDLGRNNCYLVEVPVPENPKKTFRFKSPRWRIQRISKKFCCDTRWMECAFDSTGFEASEVRTHSIRTKDLLDTNNLSCMFLFVPAATISVDPHSVEAHCRGIGSRREVNRAWKEKEGYTDDPSLQKQRCW